MKETLLRKDPDAHFRVKCRNDGFLLPKIPKEGKCKSGLNTYDQENKMIFLNFQKNTKVT